MNEDNRCVVARIMYGGMIHRQGKRSILAYVVTRLYIQCATLEANASNTFASFAFGP